MLPFVLAGVLSVAPICAPISGAEALFAKPDTRIVWVGEMHGTVQSPDLFFDLVCAASKVRRPVIVALERGQSEQAAWDAFLRADEPTAARAALAHAGLWVSKSQDGRSSRAMLALADRLRLARRAGVVADVRLIIPPLVSAGGHPFDRQAYEANMAKAVADIAKAHPHALVLAYSGSAHNRRDQNHEAAPAYTYAAGLLPAETVITVQIIGQAGQAWNCQDDCGEHVYRSMDKGDPRMVEPISPGGTYDFTAHTGQAMTASPRAVQP